ncbi:uncharacterized protein VTP21DRAFT_5680 [Calcarisporiella thermophila]|uniref:uncharacterized protein n=1 Tax=Calcarisporiella thermophila TaxID=911321 RepID=UPI00374327D2
MHIPKTAACAKFAAIAKAKHHISAAVWKNAPALTTSNFPIPPSAPSYFPSQESPARCDCFQLLRRPHSLRPQSRSLYTLPDFLFPRRNTDFTSSLIPKTFPSPLLQKLEKPQTSPPSPIITFSPPPSFSHTPLPTSSPTPSSNYSPLKIPFTQPPVQKLAQTSLPTPTPTLPATPLLHHSPRSIPLTQSSVKQSAQTQVSSDGLTRITTLANGVRVASFNAPGHIANVGIFIRAGPRFETENIKGVSHILDRMAFKSTTNRTSEEVLQEIGALGGQSTCTSSREAIIYHSAVFKRDLRRTFSLLSDIILHPKHTPSEIAEQCEIAAREVQEIVSQPDMLLPEILHMTAFKKNTLGNPMLYNASHGKVNPEMVRKAWQGWFTPERVVITTTGANHDEVIALAEEYFGNFGVEPKEDEKRKQRSLKSLFSPHPLSTSPRFPLLRRSFSTCSTSGIVTKWDPSTRVEEHARYTGGVKLIPQPDMPLTHLYLAFEGVPAHDPDAYPLATLHTLLGGGDAFSSGGPGKGIQSRLYAKIVAKYDWVEACNAFQHAYSDSGLFGLRAVCVSGQGLQLVAMIARELSLVLLTDTEQLRGEQGGITEAELQRAKNKLKAALLMSLETSAIQIEELAKQVLLLGRCESAEEICEKIDRITVRDIVRVAQRIFRGRVTIVAQGEVEGLQHAEKILCRCGIGKLS